MHPPARPRRLLAGLAPLLVTGLLGCSGEHEPSALAYTSQGDVLTLIAGTFTRSCEDIDSILMQCGRWELAVHLRPAAQSGEQPMDSDDTWAENILSDGGYNSDECTIRAGVFEQGNVEVTEITDDAVRFTLTGTEVGKFDADGSFEARWCK